MHTNIRKYNFIRLTKDDIEDVIRMRKEGRALRYIADYIGCTSSAIKYQCDKAGIPNMNRLKWSQVDDNRLVNLYNSGTSILDISKALNRSTRAIISRVYRLREYNVITLRRQSLMLNNS